LGARLCTAGREASGEVGQQRRPPQSLVMEEEDRVDCSIQLQADWVRNDIFRARAGLRLEQNQAGEEGARGTRCWRGEEREERDAVRTETYLWSCVPVAPEPVAGTPGLQRADAAPELVARTLALAPRWCSTERGLLSGLRRGEQMEEIDHRRDELRLRRRPRVVAKVYLCNQIEFGVRLKSDYKLYLFHLNLKFSTPSVSN
jgi:hypothetical protein